MFGLGGGGGGWMKTFKILSGLSRIIWEFVNEVIIELLLGMRKRLIDIQLIFSRRLCVIIFIFS